MYKRSAILLTALALAACGGDGEEANTTADTTVVPGTDVVDVPTTVPTSDTIVTEQTITTDTDTIHGDAADSVADTTHRP